MRAVSFIICEYDLACRWSRFYFVLITKFPKQFVKVISLRGQTSFPAFVSRR